MVWIGLLAGSALHAASLTPTMASLRRQVTLAEAHGYQRAMTSDDVYQEVRSGAMVQLRGNQDYEVKSTMSLPFARPEVRLFVETLAAGYREACGERLVLTSLVRPKSRQPRNSHSRSAHQLGLAMDLRRSWKRSCRGWLEANLLYLEGERVLEAARESSPPHYHVVLFTDPYLEYLARVELQGAEGRGPGEVGYVVQRGDTLWKIANRYGLEVSTLRDFNALRSSTIRPGQLLRVPSLAPTSGTR